MVVQLQPVYQQFNEALLTLLSGVAVMIGAYVRTWLLAHAKFLGEQTDATLAAGLNRALSNGVQIAMQKTDELEKQYPGVPVKGAIAAWAAQYAIDHSQDAMQRFGGLTLDDLATKALAYLPTPAITDDTTGKVILAPASVQVTNLTPVK